MTLSEDTSWRLRVSSSTDGAAKVFARKSMVTVGPPLSFDIDYPGVTALEHLLAAIGGDLVNGFGDLARRKRLAVESVEATIEGTIDNPLQYLSVLGEEDGHCGLSTVSAKVFVSSLEEEGALAKLWDATLRRSPTLSSLHPRIALDLSFRIVF